MEAAFKSSSIVLNPASVEALRASLQGSVIERYDADYDTARLAWNLAVEQYPEVIVMAESASDVAEAVRFARRENLAVAVQATGHGVIREADDAVLIVTAHMTGVSVDVEAKTAKISAGAKWGNVLPLAQAAGLAPLLGSSSDVGAVGYTLGGGMGWIGRKYGLAADTVISFEIVTAEGEISHVSKDEHSDLFNGLRGGGASYALITAMEVRLFPVTQVYGGYIMYPANMAREVMTRYRDWAETLPEDITSSVTIMNFPPIPEMPEVIRGKSFVIVRGMYEGDMEAGKALIDEWRSWTTPVVDTFEVMPFSQSDRVSEDPVHPLPGQSSGAWLSALTDEAIDVIINYTLPQGGPPALIKSEVRHADGAIARGSSALHREAQFVLQTVGVAPSREAYEALSEYHARMKRDLQPVLTGKVYMNWLEGEEARSRTRDAFAEEKYRQLVALKTRYDPENVFRFGYNIPVEK